MQNELFYNEQAVRDEFLRQLKAGAQIECPTCGRHAQIYRRKFHASMALQLIRLYRLGGETSYIHASQLIIHGVSGAGDFSKAKYWGLIVPRMNTDAHTRCNGMWMLSADGVQFVLGALRIPDEVHVFDDKLFGVGTREITIKDALGKRFNYHELMEENL